MTPLQDAALEYLGAGLHLLALTGKRPNGRVHGESWSWDDSFNGDPNTAAEIEAVITAFSEEQGTTGIAILIPPGLLVADVDSERAAALLTDLGWTKDEDSIIAITKNGLHIWFVMPGADRNCWLGDGQQPDPGRTLLFKGLGGYVVAPPSLHFAADGEQDGSYEWGANPLVVGGALRMPDILPAKARDIIKAEDQFSATKPEKVSLTTFTQTYEEGLKWWQWPKAWTYGLEGLERTIENAADGNQNACIMWAAAVAQEEGVPYAVAMERLLAAALRGNHPRKRAYDTIRGVYKRRGSA